MLLLVNMENLFEKLSEHELVSYASSTQGSKEYQDFLDTSNISQYA